MIWRILYQFWIVGKSDGLHVHIHCHKYGFITRVSYQILLQARDDGKLYQREQIWFWFCFRKQSVNANRLQVHALEYNVFNWFRRLALSANRRKQRINIVRVKLLKIAAKVVHSARYIIFKLCSRFPYKSEFYETISNIGKLNVQLK